MTLLVAVQIVYTPIHLAAEPHSDEADYGTAAPPVSSRLVLSEEDHGGDGHHERHSAVQHKLKVVRSQRAPAPDMVLVTVVAAEIMRDCAQPQVFVFSGLSPPELPRCWQFVFRAALPVRAPSIFS